MDLLITGSRGIKGPVVYTVLDGFHAKHPITRLIHGGARGVDQYSGGWAANRDIPTRVYQANWKDHGLKAGYRRNAEMIANHPGDHTMLLAIWDGQSRGTIHMLKQMRKSCASNKALPVFHSYMPLNPWNDLHLAWSIPHITLACQALQDTKALA